MDKDNKITVLVTGVGGGGLGEQIVKALKLSSLKVHIIGTDVTKYSSGFSLVNQSFVVPKAKDKDYLTILLELCVKNKVRVLFYGSEAELLILSSYRNQFEKEGIFLPINSESVLDTCLDKAKTSLFFKENKIPHPFFLEVTAIEQLNNYSMFPAVVKPSVGGGGSAMTGIAQNKGELLFLSKQLLDMYGKFIIQEYVGTPDMEFTVGVLSDMDSRVLNSIVVQRFILSTLSNRLKVPNKTQRKELGGILALSNGISQGWIGKHQDIQNQCEKIALAIGAKGAINIQGRYVDGQFLPFEINPRFSGTTSLRAMVGYNEPEILIRLYLLKEYIEPYFSYSSGIITRSLVEQIFYEA